MRLSALGRRSRRCSAFPGRAWERERLPALAGRPRLGDDDTTSTRVPRGTRAMRTASVLALALAAAAAAADDQKPAVGSKVGNLPFTDIRYAARSLDDFRDAKAVALVFVANGCPVAERYLPALQALHKDYAPRGVHVVAVNVGADDTVAGMAAA